MVHQKDILYMQSLGGFSLSWNGNSISNSSRSGESQFLLLMQVMIHNRKTGVTRDQIMDLLFYDRDVKDNSHSLHVLIYNTKKRLLSMGLPDVKYIERKHGIYYWTSKIPVYEDTDEFEKAFKRAEESESLEEKLRFYLKACDIYAGEFLPLQASILWVAREARKYREIFTKCVEGAAEIMKVKKLYSQMEALGKYAAKLYPYTGWERITMEALLLSGNLEAAQKFYRDTEKRYLKDMRLPLDKRMVDLLNMIMPDGKLGMNTIETIKNQLESTRKEVGGYFCTYPVFEYTYKMTERLLNRTEKTACLMLCSIKRNESTRSHNKILSDQARALESAIISNIRRTDTCCRYGKGQYLVLLVGLQEEDCDPIIERILTQIPERWHNRIEFTEKRVEPA